jgi:hypothetical protein
MNPRRVFPKLIDQTINTEKLFYDLGTELNFEFPDLKYPSSAPINREHVAILTSRWYKHNKTGGKLMRLLSYGP